jgi:hypothetical protein
VNRRAAGSDRQFRTRSSEVFACQGMHNVVQGPPGSYECVAIISSQELTMTRRSNRRYDFVNNTSLLRWIPVGSHFGNKTLTRSSSIPQICFDALRQNQLEKGNKEKRRRPCCRPHRNRRRSSADCYINRLLSPPAQTSLLFELYTRPTVCGVVADAFVFSFVQTADVL